MRANATSDDFPGGVLVETTLRCPADCVICPNKKITGRRRDIDWDLFCSIVDECRDAGVAEFHPFINGEPLSWPRLADGLDYLSRMLPEAAVHIYTSGHGLDRGMTARLLGSSVSEVHFSIDGFSKAVYEAHRRGLSYERVMANVAAFLEAVRRQHAAIATRAVMTLTDDNGHEAAAFRDYWRGRVDVVEVLPCDGRGGQGRSPACDEGRRLPCFQVASRACVLSDGSVVGCCKDSIGHSVFGNVATEPLREIWNSPDYRRFREEVTGDAPGGFEVCRRCLTDRL
ncbi:MAG: radical SAM/SPASM domain-containing protein [Dehalococcoidales bacterium]